MSYFNFDPFFVPEKGILEKKLEGHKNCLEDIVSGKIEKFERINQGQGINYKIFVAGEQKPQFLLKILSIKGYPDIEQLKACYTLLAEIKISHPEIIHNDQGNLFFPYGFIIQRWIGGIDAVEKYGVTPNRYDWIDDYINVFKKIHAIKLKRYGNFNAKLNFDSITEYYVNIYPVVADSFGKILKEEYSLYDLESGGIITKGFLDIALKKIINLVSSLHYKGSPVLVYGDMCPTNLIYTPDNDKILIDWDEARASWPIYEIARCLYYVKLPGILSKFFKDYPEGVISREVADIGIRLEHARQLLRQLFMLGFLSQSGVELKSRAIVFQDEISNLIDLQKPLKYWHQ